MYKLRILVFANVLEQSVLQELFLYIRIEECPYDIQLNQSNFVERSNSNQQSNGGKLSNWCKGLRVVNSFSIA